MDNLTRIHRYLLGNATEAEIDQLDRLLADDPQLRREFRFQAEIDTYLREVSGEGASEEDGASGDGAAEETAIARDTTPSDTTPSDTAPSDPAPKTRPRRESRNRRTRWWIPVSAAAAVILAVLGWQLLPNRHPAPEASVYPTPAASGSFSVAGGGPLRREATLTTEKQEATLDLGGYCTVKIEPNSKAKIEGSEGNECILLEQGGVVSQVNRGRGVNTAYVQRLERFP